ncbi:MAG: DUF6541 family protein [Candidatus Dormibacteria bacterium]
MATGEATVPVRRVGLRVRLSPSAAVPVLVIVLGLLAYHQIYTVYRFDTPVHGDGEGYYAYLPAWFLFHDAGFNSLIRDHLLPAYAALGHQQASQFGFSLQATGNWLDKYGVGEALLLLPFFGIGHAVAVFAGTAADGYTNAEVYTVGAAALVYMAAGLFALRAVLRRWFPEWVIVTTLLAITLGTSLFDFATWESLGNHAFSFFVVALLMLEAFRWYERPRSWTAPLLMGALAGLLLDIRLTNAVLLIAVPLLGVGSVKQLRTRGRLLWEQRLKVAAGAGVAVLVFVPQSVAWYIATGHVFVRSYPGESFDFLHPHLLESLFWLQPHGLLPYAPVLTLAFAGLVWAWVKRRDIALPVTAAFLPFWYLVSSWYDWSYSQSFGQRGFIDVLPFLALPLAFLLASLRARWVRVAAVAVTGVMVGATTVLMVAYWQYRVAGNGLNWTDYAAIFRHPHLLFGPPQFPSWMPHP